MPLGEIAGELLVGAVRAVAGFVAELVLEILIKGPGYVICRFFKKDIDPDGAWVVIGGVLFWILVGAVVYFTYQHVSTRMAIEGCLDSGGDFNARTNTCVRK